MCAQFLIKTQTSKLSQLLNLRLPEQLKDKKYDEHIVPFSYSPVIVDRGEGPELREMRFHLTPRWSKTERVKWATYNARLESIEQKASFRSAFKDNHCLVLLSEFIEPIYESDFAGNMVAFGNKTEELLLAAGVFDEWLNPQTGEVIESYSIITSKPCEQIDQMGHDRQPVFLDVAPAEKWLNSPFHGAQDMKNFLVNEAQQLKFSARKFRAMKPGWEKRK